jgi:hypothetical protein
MRDGNGHCLSCRRIPRLRQIIDIIIVRSEITDIRGSGVAPQWSRDMTLVGICALGSSRNHLVGRLRDVAFLVCCTRSSVRDRLIGGHGLSGKTSLLLSSLAGSTRTHLCLDVFLGGQLGL